ncbi:MAG: hypothetical protein U5N56_05330 [Candidatus Marinimicrobia bacterium]|nr:hypothetical protein [Candidatus Neomarinimicrobiota bacterium]
MPGGPGFHSPAGCVFELVGERIEVGKASYDSPKPLPAGSILLSKKQFAIHCRDGYFLPQELQSPGRKMMKVADWMNAAGSDSRIKAE